MNTHDDVAPEPAGDAPADANPVAASAPAAVADVSPATAENATESAQDICAAYHSDFVPPAPLDKVAIALSTLEQWPLNARRVTPEPGYSGWYIWGGQGQSSGAGFFQPLHVAHLLERCPQIMPYLALAPGWRVRIEVDSREVIAPVAATANTGNRVARDPAGRRHSPQSPVGQWVWLSILLHVLLIVLFGDATGEGSGRGTPGGGPLSVRLRENQVTSADSMALRTDATLRAPPARVRDAAADKNLPVQQTPDQAGTSSPAPAPSSTEPPTTAVTEATPPPVPAPAPLPPVATAVEAAPVQTLPPVIAKEVEVPVTSFVVPAAIAPLAPPPVAASAKPAEPKLDSLIPFTPPAAAARTVAPGPSLPALSLPGEGLPVLAAPVQAERTLPPALEAAPRMKTFVPPAPAKVETIAKPVELPSMAPLAPPVKQDSVRPAELLPRLTPLAPAPVLEAATPASIAPRFVAPASPNNTPVAPPPVANANAAETRDLPRAVPDTSTTSPVTPPVAAEMRTPATNLPPSSTAGTPADAPSPAGIAVRAQEGSAKGDSLAPGGIFAAPLRGPTLPPATPPPTPRIDLDAVRQRARELAREGSDAPRTLLPLNVGGKEDTRTKEQKAFDKALKRPDCKDAYAALGLAAVVPLVRDALTEKGCKW